MSFGDIFGTVILITGCSRLISVPEASNRTAAGICSPVRYSSFGCTVALITESLVLVPFCMGLLQRVLFVLSVVVLGIICIVILLVLLLLS